MALKFFKNSLKISGIFLFVHMAHSADDSLNNLLPQPITTSLPIPKKYIINQEHHNAMFLQAVLFDQKGQFAEAEKLFEKEARQNNIEAMPNWYLALIKQNKYPSEDALQYLAIAAANGQSVAMYLMGQISFKIGCGLATKGDALTSKQRFSEAEIYLRQAAKSDIIPAAPELIAVLETMGREIDEEALKLLTKYANNGHSNCMHALGVYFTRMQNFQQAEIWFIKALKAGMTLNELGYNLAILAIRQDKPIGKNIIEWLNNPENEEAKKKFEKEKNIQIEQKKNQRKKHDKKQYLNLLSRLQRKQYLNQRKNQKYLVRNLRLVLVYKANQNLIIQ